MSVLPYWWCLGIGRAGEGRGRSAAHDPSAVAQPDGNGVAIAEPELLAQMNLAEQLDLVARIAVLSGFDGLERESAEALGDGHRR